MAEEEGREDGWMLEDESFMLEEEMTGSSRAARLATPFLDMFGIVLLLLSL